MTTSPLPPPLLILSIPREITRPLPFSNFLPPPPSSDKKHSLLSTRFTTFSRFFGEGLSRKSKGGENTVRYLDSSPSSIYSSSDSWFNEEEEEGNELTKLVQWRTVACIRSPIIRKGRSWRVISGRDTLLLLALENFISAYLVSSLGSATLFDVWLRPTFENEGWSLND